MRRSTAFVLGILLIALTGVLMVADRALGPFRRDAQVSLSLTERFEGQGSLVAGTRLTCLRVPGGRNRLVADGRGLLLHADPAAAVRERPGGLTRLAQDLARAAAEAYGGERLDWAEVVFRREAKDVELRALLTLGDEGVVGAPEPPLPATWPAPAPVPSPATPPVPPTR